MTNVKERGGGTFLLFVSGVPFEDAGLGPGYILTAPVGRGPLGVDRWGGHEPADGQPGQLFGESARAGRMVLDLAKRHGLSVKVIDVNHPGEDEALFERYARPDDDLPILVRPDGARLAGDAAFVPGTVERFLTGR